MTLYFGRNVYVCMNMKKDKKIYLGRLGNTTVLTARDSPGICALAAMVDQLSPSVIRRENRAAALMFMDEKNSRCARICRPAEFHLIPHSCQIYGT